jgi:hypothetical protein
MAPNGQVWLGHDRIYGLGMHPCRCNDLSARYHENISLQCSAAHVALVESLDMV